MSLKNRKNQEKSYVMQQNPPYIEYLFTKGTAKKLPHSGKYIYSLSPFNKMM
jgi:hypothetical protein